MISGQIGAAQLGSAQLGSSGSIASSAVNLSFSDKLSLFDVIAYLETNATTGAIVILITDSTQNEAGLLDSFIENVGIPIQKIDSVSFSDAITSAQIIGLIPSDSLNLSDLAASYITGILSQSPIDSINFSDAAGTGNPGKIVEALFDFFNFSDSVSRSANLKVPVSDNLVFSDQVFDGTTAGDSLLYLIFLSDSLSISDAVVPVIGIVRSPTDTIVFSESNALGSGPTGLTVSDNIVLSDLFSLLGTNVITQNDSLTLTDLVNLYSALSIPLLTDSLSFNDSPTILTQGIAPTLSVSDTLTLLDAIAVALTSSKLQFSDSLSLIDSINVQLIVNFNSYLRQYLNDVTGISNP